MWPSIGTGAGHAQSVLHQDAGVPVPVSGSGHGGDAWQRSAYEDFSRQVREEHEAIVAAIRAGDEMAARNAAQTHMFNAARR
jgi:hypothetical protein